MQAKAGYRLSYTHAQYAQSLASFGAPRRLPRSGGWVCVRPVAGHEGLRDATGVYPLFSCANWEGLPGDLEDLRRDGLVSVVLVADPLDEPPVALLPQWFDGVCRPWKMHYLVDLDRGDGQPGTAHHRRNARRFLRHAEIEACTDPPAHLETWCALYGQLIDRHRITGPARFSREAFALQLALPGAVLLRAVTHAGETVGMQLWFTRQDKAWHHLSGYAPEGYRWGGASYALMQVALAHLRRLGVRTADLGAAAGLSDRPDDGLSRFKAGWSTRTAAAWLCGAVLDAKTYAALAPAGSAYFPAYRDPALSPSEEVLSCPC